MTVSGCTGNSKRMAYVITLFIDPASLQVDRRARRVKTDRIDTERLLRSLMAYLRGEPKVWSVVRVPSVPKRTRGGCTESVIGWSRSALSTEQFRTAQGGPFPPRLKSEIMGELQRLELEVEMIATLEADAAIVEDEAFDASQRQENPNSP